MTREQERILRMARSIVKRALWKAYLKQMNVVRDARLTLLLQQRDELVGWAHTDDGDAARPR